ncbi:CPCC family cysteine-rich protein [Actinoplanes sp. NPDC051411]|jgi:hypothetical protein|uniref:CPCC family cysteine-rich protein n=1 Tax=Actinoplanes sp. NPDC051411 TaxID=3155522 RepID=UPI003416B188
MLGLVQAGQTDLATAAADCVAYWDFSSTEVRDTSATAIAAAAMARLGGRYREAARTTVDALMTARRNADGALVDSCTRSNSTEAPPRPQNGAVPEHPVLRGPDDDPSMSDEELLHRRTAWFNAYTSLKNVVAPPRDVPYTCPCCGHATLPERGVYDICGECGWEDDGQDNHDSHLVRGGPNGRESLDQARAKSARQGVTLQPHVPPSEPI